MDTADPTRPPSAHLIGETGCPIRAFAFSSGSFDTAMQLGVTHALLVIQGKPPDAVVGISAGAISAVALAEILQAHASEAPDTPESLSPEQVKGWRRQVLEARVKRFREVFDGYQRAPSELIEAALPDTLQLSAKRPLAPLQLPIHHQSERVGRQNSVQSRAGLINLYNQLLEFRMSVGTVTRAVRRGLGIIAAPELRPAWRKRLAVIAEAARCWLLLGFNLTLAAPLLRPLGRPYFRSKPAEEHGESAATLIFRSKLARRFMQGVGNVVSFAVLAAFWFGLSLLIVAVLPWLVGMALLWVAGWIGWSPQVALQWIDANALRLALGLVVIALAGLVAAWVWRRSLLSILRQLVAELVDFVLLLATGIAVVWVVVMGLRAAVGLISGLPLAQALSNSVPNSTLPVAGFILALAAFSVLVLLGLWLAFPRDYARRLLAEYDLADSLFSEHPLRQLIIQVLDPGYYGSDRMDDIVERALRDDQSPSDVSPKGTLVRDYARRRNCRPIYVGLAVADVASGELSIVKDYVKVVKGLLAATAITPLLKPQEIDGKLYVDGANIANEATHLVLDFLRPQVNPEASVVHVYTVVPLPFTGGALGGRKDKQYLTLVEVVLRALQLQRFRDASLERRLTELYTSLIPPSTGVLLRTSTGNSYLRAWVTPVEPERPLELGRQLFAASDKLTRRDLIARTVADGCRAALEVMIRPSLGPFPQPPERAVSMPCREAVRIHLAARQEHSGRKLPIIDLPGSDSKGGPGLAEVCSHCALQPEADDPSTDRKDAQSIRKHSWTTMGPAWPHELEIECETPKRDPHFSRAPVDYEVQTQEALEALSKAMDHGTVSDPEQWPRARNGLSGTIRPLVSLLFSGGVFRGVYQMGVLTALSEADIQPDIVAGASVGSITAALVAESFSEDRGIPRDARIARLGATYLALDRLILTDRFADFIRNVTLRAAATGFSLRQADRFFRRYDSASAGRFDSEARLVMAGLERLLYVSPFELKELVKALREQNMPRVTLLLQRYLQEWLERMGCGDQLLGAEPLALVITEHVLSQLSPGSTLAPMPFDAFLRRRGIYFLATATNLTNGRLEVLGEQQLVGGRRQALLLEGLLASSAFPGVFRPRWSWELMPATPMREQYIDGGVMDNLPLDAVTQFMFQASRGHLIAARPVPNGVSVPHLLFSASLEVHQGALTPREVSPLQDDWLTLTRRTRVLKYNKKLQGYAAAQRAVRDIWSTQGVARSDAALVPVDLEVATVIPNWLCGTFAFHPMLGFRRAHQAESIAHGCASTLIAIGRLVHEHPDWTAGWGIDPSQVPSQSDVTQDDPYAQLKDHLTPRGRCWLRPSIDCPFGRSRLEQTGLLPQTMIELERIHLACRREKTHRAR